MLRLADGTKLPLVQVRRSRVHGNGVFALRRIRKGTRIIEYIGERVSHKEADRRYETQDPRQPHISVHRRQAHGDRCWRRGNEARFINHPVSPTASRSSRTAASSSTRRAPSSRAKSSATTTRSSASKAIRPTSTRSMPVAAARRSVAAPCSRRTSCPSVVVGPTVAETQMSVPALLREHDFPGIVAQLVSQGWSCCENFLPAKLIARLRAEARQLAASGELHRSGDRPQAHAALRHQG